MKIVVLGDVILDVYINVTKTQMSPEAPVFDSFINNDQWEFKQGGATNVAENLKALGCDEVMMIGVVGDDCWGSKFPDTDVDYHLLRIKDTLTTTKIRLMDNSRQIYRISYEAPKPLSAKSLVEICRQIPVGGDWRFILVDYNKGFWQGHVSPIMEAIGKREFCAMPKPENISVFRKGRALSFNSKEFDAALFSNNVSPAEFCLDLEIESLMVTHGAEGLNLFVSPWEGRHVPARRVEVADVCGAGDTTAAVFFYFLYKNYSDIDAATFANHAGSLVVQKRGCVTLSQSEVSGIASLRR